MTVLSITRGQNSELSKPTRIWNYLIGVLLSVVLIIAISKYAYNLIPERSDFVETEKVANEAYKKYSQKLEALSEESMKEIKATNKEN